MKRLMLVVVCCLGLIAGLGYFQVTRPGRFQLVHLESQVFAFLDTASGWYGIYTLDRKDGRLYIRSLAEDQDVPILNRLRP